MAFLKTSPEKQAARELEVAKASRETLAARLVDAEALMTDRRTAAQRLAREGADDSALDKAEANLRSAQDRTVTLGAALAQTDADVTALEKQIADAADLKLRSDTVAELDKLIATLQHTGQAMEKSAAALAECTGRAATHSFDASGLHSFALKVKAEMPDAIKLIAADLRFKAAQVLNGKTAAKLPEPSPVEVKAPASPEPMLPASFIEVDRGPPVTMRIATRPIS